MRASASSQMGFGQIAIWLLAAGGALPMFFLPLTGMALGSVNVEETAGAAGILNFVRSLAGAVATSIVTTAWENSSSRSQAELSGVLHDAQGAIDSLAQTGMGAGQALNSVTNIVQSQAVMLATNQVLFLCALVFAAAGAVIWLAPRPARVADASAAH
jgi:DHA2 family multidrug resistance protein